MNTKRMTIQETVRVWRDKRYPEAHFAKSPTGYIKPPQVDPMLFGHHISAVFSQGVRHWMFQSRLQRDRFVNEYRHRGAQPCGDPYP